MINDNRSPILEVKDLKKYFPIKRGWLGKVVGNVKAVDGVSFSLPTGTTLGLVGESGCGKTTTSRCLLRAIPASSGQVIFHDEELGPVDVVGADKETLRCASTCR
ncbi:MAG: ATP-binding cassette domain-containing protein [Caldilineaceae bacterium]